MNVVHRNAFLLAAGLVFQSGMIQLAVALGTVTLVTVTGIQGILGAGPAVFLIAGAVAVGPAGRLSDRIGRMPVIRSGFVLGMIGPAVTAGGCAVRSGALVVAGLGLCGAAQSIVLLSRAAAAEMFPPERRARGMSIVLFGVVSGAIWGPLVFGPMFANRALTAHELVVPWLAAGAVPARRPGDLRRRAARPEDARLPRPGTRPAARRPSESDPPAARCGDGDGRRRGELLRDGRGDEPCRLHRRRPRTCTRRRLHDHQPAHRGDVRPDPHRRRARRAHRPEPVDRRRAGA